MLVKSSFSAWINFACASASDDSDWDTSDKVICPLSTRIWSVSTCLLNNSTLSRLIFNFSFAKTKPV